MPKWALVPLLCGGCIANGQATEHVDSANRIAPLEAPPPPRHSAFARFEFLGPVLRMEFPADTPSHGSQAWDGQHVARQLSEHFTEKLKDVGKLGRPQDFLLDAMRFAWQAKTSPDLVNSALLQTLAVSGPTSLFPSSLREHYTPEKMLGKGSFATTYLAKDKVTGKEVAVKVLMAGAEGQWLTKKDYLMGGPMKELVDQSLEECQTMIKIHSPTMGGVAATDMLGGDHVSKCVFDGIAEALKTESSVSNPLFIVMEYAGQNDLNKWWLAALGPPHWHDSGKEPMQGQERQWEIARKDLRSLTRQLMQGLDYMANPKRDVQWAQHDLKPQNIVVNYAKNLTIIDMGTALSSDKPGGESACTPVFRPPEHAGIMPAVGFTKPYYSFDMFSAALTLISLVSGGGPDSGAGPDHLFLPNFYSSALMLGIMKMAHFRTFVKTADCVSEEVSAQSIDPVLDISKWLLIIKACGGRVTAQTIGNEVTAALNKVQRASRGAGRRMELTKLAGCKPEETSPLVLKSTSKSAAPILQAVVGEWVESGFDDMLLQMLSSDPTKRPEPAKVIEEQWLDLKSMYTTNYEPQTYNCPDLQEEVAATLMKFVYPLIVLCCAGFFGCCASCCGPCFLPFCTPPRRAGSIQISSSTTFLVGGVLGVYLGAGAFAGTMWLPLDGYPTLIIGGLLSVASGVCGIVMMPSQGNTVQQAKLGWAAILSCSILYFLVLLITSYRTVSNLLTQLTFAQMHMSEILKDSTLTDLANNPELDAEKLANMASLFRNFVLVTLYPGVCGIPVALFGIWRTMTYWGASEPQLPTAQVEMKTGAAWETCA